MTPITTAHYVFLSAALFTIGVIGVLTRRNVVIILMSIELILNAVNINLVAFSRQFLSVNGQAFAVFGSFLPTRSIRNAPVTGKSGISQMCSRKYMALRLQVLGMS